MSEAPHDWTSFCDLTTPAQAADLLRAEHGVNALEAAEHCAAVADGDARETDRQFWTAVVAELKVTSN